MTPYADFRADFAAGLEHWDAVDWARLFRRARARYVVLVTKHHDGFCLWPSRVANPHRLGWTTKRDLVGELAEAVRAGGRRITWPRPSGRPAESCTRAGDG